MNNNQTKEKLKKLFDDYPHLTTFSFFCRYFPKWNYSTVKSFINKKSTTDSIPNIEALYTRFASVINALKSFEGVNHG